MKKLSKLMALLLALVLAFGTAASALAESNIVSQNAYYEAANEALHDFIMGTTTWAEYWEVAGFIDEADFDDFYYNYLTEEEQEAMAERMEALFWEGCVPFTGKVGPFLPPVNVGGSNAGTDAQRSFSGNDGIAIIDKEPTENGLILSKTATSNGDGSYKIQLEAYVTGEVTTSTVEKVMPCDIVLVLDLSYSMTYQFGRDTRYNALKTAVKNFISNTADQYNAETADHRISIVAFSKGINENQCADWTFVDQTGETTLTNKINSYPNLNTSTNGATDTDDGVARAQSLLIDNYSYYGPNRDRQKVVVLFTDGLPGVNTSFDTSIATGAIASANTIKNAGATVFSVAIYDGANPETTIDTTPNRDVDRINVLLHAISSNYPEATARTTGNYYNQDWTVTLGTGGNKNYYLTAASPDDLNKVFKTISDQIVSGSASMELGSSTVIQDIVAPQFVLPNGVNDINVTQVASLDGTRWASTGETVQNAVTIDPDTNSVSVTGFDFTHNFVADEGRKEFENSQSYNFFGRKLVISFNVPAVSGFLGGNKTETNDLAGVYSDGTKVEEFPVPKLDIEVETITPTINNDRIYLTNEVDLENLLGLHEETNYFEYALEDEQGNLTYYPIDGVNNEYVDITYTFEDADGNMIGTYTIEAGEIRGTMTYAEDVNRALTEDTVYTITCTVDPIETGTYSETNKTVTGTVHVYKPELTFKDGTIEYNTSFPTDEVLTAGTNGGYVSVAWKHHGTTAPSDMGTAPAITLSYSPDWNCVDAENGIVTALDEVPVTVSAKIGTNEVIGYSTCYRNACNIVGEVSGEICEWHETGESGNDPAFVLHVYNTVGDLKISKQVVYDQTNSKTPNANDAFTFTITLDEVPETGYAYQIYNNNGEAADTTAGTVQTMTAETVTVSLKHDQYVLFSDVMCDTTYTVAEVETSLPADYTLESNTDNLTGEIEPAETIEVEFVNRYHKLGSLTITKTGLNQYIYTDGTDNESAIFTVTGPNNETWTVVLTGNKSVTIDNLLAGTYTVSEQNGWTWRYSNIDPKSATISQGSDETVTFSNQHANQSWLGGDNYKTNVFGD